MYLLIRCTKCNKFRYNTGKYINYKSIEPNFCVFLSMIDGGPFQLMLFQLLPVLLVIYRYRKKDSILS